MDDFKIFHTNCLDSLAAHLAREVIASPLPPLQSEAIVIQSEGMAYWLKLRLAELTGCAAGLQMLFPSSFCRRICNAPPSAESGAQWEIFAALSDADFVAAHPQLVNFLRDDSGLRRLQLAGRLAALFENYQVYRHEMLLRWESGELAQETQAGRWQAELWNRLGCFMRANDFKRALDNPGGLALPGRLNVFGASTLPPLFTTFLHRLSTRIPVRIYLPVPSPHYFADLRSSREIAKHPDAQEQHLEYGNRLLGNLGKMGREFFRILGNLDNGGQAWQELEFRAPGCATILSTLQHDIHNISERTDEERLIMRQDDDSLRVHCCHGPFREVEVLREQLLDLLARDSSLQPADILVLLSDVETYAPWVDTVFSSCPVLGRHYRIPERPRTQEDPHAQALLELLALPDGRQEAEDLLRLLDYQPVREAAGIGAGDLREVRELLLRLNVCAGSGLRGARRTGVPEQNSWLFGLHRLLMGYACGDCGETVAGISPYFPQTEFELCGRLAQWLYRLLDWCALAGRSASLSEWKRRLDGLCTRLMGMPEPAEDEENWLHIPIREDCADLPLEVIREYLRQNLGQNSGRGAFLGGGISFCALRPMRTVPFRVVAVLGMGYTQFPRRNRREGFDLMQLEPQTGDRNTREDDCQLFLETLLSARERLIITYTGRSAKDSSVSPPSTCVSELLEVVERTFLPAAEGRPASAALIIEHPLQPYRPTYFDGSRPELFSFSGMYLPPAHPQEAGQTRYCVEAEPVSAPLSLSIAELTAFWLNPAAWFCRRRLGISFPAREQDLPAHEPLSPGGLAGYRLRSGMLRTALENPAGLGGMREIFSANGDLPPENLGRAWWGCLSSEVTALSRRIGAVEPLPPRQIYLRLANAEITGSINSRTAGGLLFYRAGKLRARDMLEAWLHQLCLCATGEALPCRLFGSDAGTLLRPVEDAPTLLETLCGQMLRGYHCALPFFPQTSLAWCEQVQKIAAGSQRAGSPQSAALRVWSSDNFSIGEGAEEYFNLCFGADYEPGDAEFAELAESFWTPFLAAREEA